MKKERLYQNNKIYKEKNLTGKGKYIVNAGNVCSEIGNSRREMKKTKKLVGLNEEMEPGSIDYSFNKTE